MDYVRNFLMLTLGFSFMELCTPSIQVSITCTIFHFLIFFLLLRYVFRTSMPVCPVSLWCWLLLLWQLIYIWLDYCLILGMSKHYLDHFSDFLISYFGDTTDVQIYQHSIVTIKWCLAKNRNEYMNYKKLNVIKET